MMLAARSGPWPTVRSSNRTIALSCSHSRRRGIGAAMTSAAVCQARTAGCRSAVLTASDGDLVSRDFTAG
jgi:hypothetical protein